MLQKILETQNNYEFICSIISFYITEFKNDTTKIRISHTIRNLDEFKPSVNTWSMLYQFSHINVRGYYSFNSNILDYACQLLDINHFIEWVDANKKFWNTSETSIFNIQ